MKKISLIICFFLLAFGSACGQGPESAQDKDFAGLIRAAKSDNAAAAILEEASVSFLERNDFQKFVDFLSGVIKTKRSLSPWVAYYTGMARYRQMKYLEETQSWDEYFSKGNEYRSEIEQNLGKAVKYFAADEPLRLYSLLHLWQFHKDQQDVFNEQALSDLMAAAKAYASGQNADLIPLKTVADKLLAYEERSRARELYKIYGDRIISSDLSEDELQNIALSFYKQDNIELSQALYTVYIDRIMKKATPEKIKLELIDIARLFSYNKTGAYDLDFAEKIFAKLESLYTAGVIDESLAYQRAYNAEKNQDFLAAKDMYIAFAAAHPQSGKRDEALYKAGVLALYAGRDVRAAQEIFGSLSRQPDLSAHVISSLYQAGLIAQWQEDFTQASEAYARLIERAGSAFGETVALARARMEEIEKKSPLDFNIKSLLDVTLKPENSQFEMARVEIEPSTYSASSQEEVTVSSNATPPESGCMQVQLQYFWSGDLGRGQGYLESSFKAAYSDPGTKIIGLVVTTPGGVIDRAIALIDVN